MVKGGGRVGTIVVGVDIDSSLVDLLHRQIFRETNERTNQLKTTKTLPLDSRVVVVFLSSL
jgi:hypothetical protein